MEGESENESNEKDSESNSDDYFDVIDFNFKNDVKNIKKDVGSTT